MHRLTSWAAAALVGVGGAVCEGNAAADEARARGPVALDPELPEYEPVAGIAGDIKTVGSDTMVNLMSTWAETFGGFYPGVRVQVEGKGSSTAPPALLEGQTQFGPMSRAMEPEEIDAFRAKFGYEPTELRVAIDCVAVFVNKDCPIDEVSLSDLVRVFSVAGGGVTWGELGATDPAWRARKVSVYGRNSASGTYKFFKESALDGQDFKPSVKEQPGSSGVVQAVASDVYAMGYSGVGYATPGVKALRVSVEEGEEAFAPSYENALAGEYPLARFLYVYLNHDRVSELDGLRGEFVRMIFSRQGQEGVLKDGAYPVTAEIAREELESVGLEAGF